MSWNTGWNEVHPPLNRWRYGKLSRANKFLIPNHAYFWLHNCNVKYFRYVGWGHFEDLVHIGICVKKTIFCIAPYTIFVFTKKNKIQLIFAKLKLNQYFILLHPSRRTHKKLRVQTDRSWNLLGGHTIKEVVGPFMKISIK